jgi:hypothetical protein
MLLKGENKLNFGCVQILSQKIDRKVPQLFYWPAIIYRTADRFLNDMPFRIC